MKIKSVIIVMLLLSGLFVGMNSGWVSGERIGNHEENTGEMYVKIEADHYTPDKLYGQQTNIANMRSYQWGYQTFKEEIDIIRNISLYVRGDAYDFFYLWIYDDNGVYIGSSDGVAVTTAGWYTFSFGTSGEEIEFNATHRMQIKSAYDPDFPSMCTGEWYYSNADTYANGSASWDSGKDASFKIYGWRQTYDGSRSYAGSIETNEINITTNTFTYKGHEGMSNVYVVIPVSETVNSIVEVRNVTCGTIATSVSNKGSAGPNEYWYDAANQDVYIGTENLTVGQSVHWTVNGTWGAYANISFPKYKKVGDDVHLKGMITDSNGNALHQHIASCDVYYENGTLALGSFDWNCTGGNFDVTFSTSTLSPGIYTITVDFTDPVSGFVYEVGETLYLSVNPPSDVHVTSKLQFMFYNSNTGLGLNPESFRLYASTDTTIDSTDRIYSTLYNTYTGDIIYYRVDDYFGNQIYPLTGNYATLNIVSVEQFEDIPVTWYDFSIKNLNDTVMHFSMENGSRYYNVTLFPMDSIHLNILAGDYNITKYFYSAINGSLLSTLSDTVTIVSDAFYIATGYNAMVHVSWYNTNEGLGLPDETLKLYFDGERSTSMNYWTYINKTVNVTIKDYYNTTLYTNNFTITSTSTFLDIGLTYHSYLFGNKNDDYYMISLLKQGGSRWWERGIVPYGEREFLIPSGNYMMRIYDKNWVEIYNSSAYDAVINSRVYVIHGTNLSEIISGQSVIRGQLLELRAELDYALAPDIEIISCNPPMIHSIYDKEGMLIGSNVFQICPALITVATTRVETTGSSINSVAATPSNNTVENGTITILEDALYISGNGSTSYVNITYTDNGTLMQNTTYVPSKINLYGQNLTIVASNDVHILRETQYNQVKKFYWTYYLDTGQHTAGINIINPMAIPIYDVYVYVEFSNESTPNPNTVVIEDVANDDKILDSDDYDVTLKGIHFYLLSIDSNSERGYTINYYKQFDDAYNYGEAQISIDGYIETEWNGLSYNTFPIGWINDEDTIFRGGLYAKLDFDETSDIDITSIRIWDDNNNQELSSSEFITGPGFIRIGAEGLGDINPGSGRSFSAYFLLSEYPGADPTEIHLNTPIWTRGGFIITPFFLIFLFGLILIGYGAYSYMYKNKKDWKKGVSLGIFIIFIFYILSYMGV